MTLLERYIAIATLKALVPQKENDKTENANKERKNKEKVKNK